MSDDRARVHTTVNELAAFIRHLGETKGGSERCKNLTSSELVSAWRAAIFHGAPDNFQYWRYDRADVTLRSVVYGIHHSGASFVRAVAYTSVEDFVREDKTRESVQRLACQLFGAEARAALDMLPPFSPPERDPSVRIYRERGTLYHDRTDTRICSGVQIKTTGCHSFEQLCSYLTMLGIDARAMTAAQLEEAAMRVSEVPV
jgi:hypothetical protein